IGTLPFTLYYFHQFPIYFWLSGLFVVPLAAVIMLLGIATLILHPFSDFLASMVSYLLSYSTWLMNQSVSLISKLPWAVSDGIWISFTQSVVLLLAIGLFARGIQPIKSGFLSAGLACLACFLSIFIVDDFR